MASSAQFSSQELATTSFHVESFQAFTFQINVFLVKKEGQCFPRKLFFSPACDIFQEVEDPSLPQVYLLKAGHTIIMHDLGSALGNRVRKQTEGLAAV